MAILDGQLKFSNAQALPSAAIGVSTNVIDLALAGTTATSNPHGFDTTDPMIMYIIWSGTPTTGSLHIQLRSATTTDITAATFRVHWSTGIIAAGNYATNGIFSGAEPTLISLPHGAFNPSLSAVAQGSGPYLQYLGVWFQTTHANDALGIHTIGLAKALDMRALAPSGYTVA